MLRIISLCVGLLIAVPALADARKDCERYDNADLKIQACTQLIMENAENLPDIYTKRGHGYAMKKDYERALVDYDRAIELDPNFALAYNLRAHAYAGKGEYDRAIADFTKALALRPDYGAIYQSRGDVYASRGSYDEAIADYDKGLVLAPGDGEYLCSRGDAFAKKGDDERARADYQEAQLDPDTPCAEDGSPRLD